jgi:hypothetical protein
MFVFILLHIYCSSSYKICVNPPLNLWDLDMGLTNSMVDFKKKDGQEMCRRMTPITYFFRKQTYMK